MAPQRVAGAAQTDGNATTTDASSPNTTKTRSGRAVEPPKRFGNYGKGAVGASSNDEFENGVSVLATENMSKSPQTPKRRKPRETNKKTDEHETESKKKFRQYLERAQKSMLKQWDDNTDNLNAKIQSLEKVIQEQGQEMQKMRTAVLKRLGEMGNVGEADDTVEETWRRAMKDVTNWAKDYTIQGKISLLDDSTKSKIVSILKSSPCPFTSEIALRRTFESGISASTIVNAIFNYRIAKNLLGQPFFFVREVRDSHSTTTLPRAINEIFRIGDQVNPNAAKAWYKQTMTMLHPHDKGQMYPPGSDKTLKKHKENRYNHCLESLMNDLKQLGLLKEINDQHTAKRAHEAFEIIETIGEYLIELTKRNEFMRTLSYNQLNSKCFKNDSDLIKPHSSQLLSEEDILNNDCPVLLVISPAVVAYGDSQGKNFDKSKIWQRAVVLVSDKDHEVEELSLEKTSDIVSKEKTTETDKLKSTKNMKDELELNLNINSSGAELKEETALQLAQAQAKMRAETSITQLNIQKTVSVSQAVKKETKLKLAGLDDTSYKVTADATAAYEQADSDDYGINVSGNQDSSNSEATKQMELEQFTPTGEATHPQSLKSKPDLPDWESSTSRSNVPVCVPVSPKREREETMDLQRSSKRIKRENSSDSEAQTTLQKMPDIISSPVGNNSGFQQVDIPQIKESSDTQQAISPQPERMSGTYQSIDSETETSQKKTKRKKNKGNRKAQRARKREKQKAAKQQALALRHQSRFRKTEKTKKPELR